MDYRMKGRIVSWYVLLFMFMWCWCSEDLGKDGLVVRTGTNKLPQRISVPLTSRLLYLHPLSFFWTHVGGLLLLWACEKMASRCGGGEWIRTVWHAVLERTYSGVLAWPRWILEGKPSKDSWWMQLVSGDIWRRLHLLSLSLSHHSAHCYLITIWITK